MRIALWIVAVLTGCLLAIRLARVTTIQAIFEDLYGNVFVAERAKPPASTSNGQAAGHGNL